MSRRVLPIALLLALFLSFPASALDADLSLYPAAPDTTRIVTLSLVALGPDEERECLLVPTSVEISNGVITLRDVQCSSAPLDASSLAVGPLAAGTYEIRALAAGLLSGTWDFTVSDGGDALELGTGPVARAVPGRDIAEVALLDVPGLEFCAQREIFPSRVERQGGVVEVLLMERPFESFCSGPSLPGDVTAAVTTRGFTSVAVRLVTADQPEVVYDLGTVQLTDPLACGPDALCLDDGRFRVTALWTTAEDSGSAMPVPLTDDSGAFWFFRPDNLELTVKVLDACYAFDRHWVFISGLTNQGVEIRVHDIVADETRVYTNDLGQGFEAVRDTDAFATCP